MTRLAGRNAVVTGAARGIGRAIALALAAEGANVLVGYRQSAEAAHEVVRAIRHLGSDSVSAEVEVSSAASVRSMIEIAVDRWTEIDILVNNAGTTSFLAVDTIDETEFDRIVAVNLKSVFLATTAALPHVRSGRGRIINISSTTGLLGPPLASHYAAAKSGVNGYTRACATELRPRGITVNAICPGGTETDMLLPQLRATGVPLDPPDLVGPQRSIGRPTDIAGAAVFLASDDAAWVTGALFVVDGGLSIR